MKNKLSAAATLIILLVSLVSFTKTKSNEVPIWNVHKNNGNGICTCQQPEERPLLGGLLRGPFYSKSDALEWACNSDQCTQVTGSNCK